MRDRVYGLASSPKQLVEASPRERSAKRVKIGAVDRVGAGEELAAVTNGIVGLFSRYYGRGPTKAKTHQLGDDLLFCVLEDTMTVVERRLVGLGHHHLVRTVRLRFQDAMAPEFHGVVEAATGRTVVAYHSQISFDPDLGFEFFRLEPRE